MKPNWLILFCLSLSVFLLPFGSNGQTISGIINSYYKATAIINYGTHNTHSYSGITLQSITGLSAGDRVLIIQMKGAAITTANSSSFGNISDIGNAGKYEFSSVCGFLNNTVVLSNHLLNSYDVANVQVIKVPVYTNVTIAGTILAKEWDPVTETGGVIAFEATGTVTLNANISADSAGFKGGPLFRNTSYHCGSQSAYYYGLTGNQGAPKGEGVAAFIANREYGRGRQANGGGGGNEDNTGGGGGANYGAGGNGGDKMGTCSAGTHGDPGNSLSGFGYTTTNNRVFLGGAGGNGESNNDYGGLSLSEGTPGGDGGGLVFIKASELIGNGFTISANGAQGVNSFLPVKTEAAGDGGGGGGAGGAILLGVTNFSGNVTVQARGANGSNAGFHSQCPGPGGGGGGGVIWSLTALPVNVTTNVAGGTAGVIKATTYVPAPSCMGLTNNANAGASGVVQSGYVAPQGTNTINCAILPPDYIVAFNGKSNNKKLELNWVLSETSNIQQLVVERKTRDGQFIKVAAFSYPVSQIGTFNEELVSSASYRIYAVAYNGERQYSNTLFFEANVVRSFHLYPNPAKEEVVVQLPANTSGKTFITLTDVNGKVVMQQEIFVQPMQSNMLLPLKQLPAGIYHVRLLNNHQQSAAKLIKQ